MSVRDFKVELCTRAEIRDFIETHHYSHNINGCIADYCFRLIRDGQMIGAMFYGRMAMAGQWKKYGSCEADVIELRRLVCIDDTPKNTESYFIGHTLRWLRRNTDIKVVVSYSDEEYGHSGVIYRASNFQHLGFGKGARVIMWNGRRYHDKTIRSKHNGVIKPFAMQLRQALDSGEAFYQSTAGKHTFIYRLK